jgi:hypothetical protein
MWRATDDLTDASSADGASAAPVVHRAAAFMPELPAEFLHRLFRSSSPASTSPKHRGGDVQDRKIVRRIPRDGGASICVTAILQTQLRINHVRRASTSLYLLGGFSGSAGT